MGEGCRLIHGSRGHWNAINSHGILNRGKEETRLRQKSSEKNGRREASNHRHSCHGRMNLRIGDSAIATGCVWRSDVKFWHVVGTCLPTPGIIYLLTGKSVTGSFSRRFRGTRTIIAVCVPYMYRCILIFVTRWSNYWQFFVPKCMRARDDLTSERHPLAKKNRLKIVRQYQVSRGDERGRARDLGEHHLTLRPSFIARGEANFGTMVKRHLMRQ